MKPLNILISNDDGVFAAGIRALAKSAQKRGHNVKVVCPDQERSATGHGLTLQSPLRVEKADELFGEGIEAWGCSGTPADCVKLALSEQEKYESLKVDFHLSRKYPAYLLRDDFWVY